jgi:uncharacterized protein (TIGR03067 family)
MKWTNVLVMTLLATSSSCIFDAHDRDESAHHSELVGRWQLVHIRRGGVDINLDHLEGSVREIKEATYSISPPNAPAITGQYTVNNTTSPKAIDEVVDNGRFQGKTLKGIYRIHDHQLTISFGGPGEDRPTSFMSKAGTNYTVAIHKRVR